jgi:hypothetical protein
MIKPARRLWVRLAGIGVIILILYGCWRVLEYTSFRILHKNNLVSEKGFAHATPFGLQLNFWEGGLENSKNFDFAAIDENLKAGKWVHSDENGFVTGDSLPLQKEKPLNTVRIFLTGGSAMWGSLQNWNIVSNHTYPQGTYTYQASIAGRLRNMLEHQFPTIKFQVINAAVVAHQFNQSYARYYEKIHDFNPDIIINMDGQNDDWIATDFEGNADPYEATSAQAQEALDLEMLGRSARYGYTFMLLNNYFLHNDHTRNARDRETVLVNITKQFSIKNAERFITLRKTKLNTSVEYPRDSFIPVEHYLERNMKKQLWLIQSYEWQLAHDSVCSIFVLQPTLARMDKQKKLSPIEQQLYHELFKNQVDSTNLTGMDSLILNVRIADKSLVAAINSMGYARYFIPRYYQRYFIGGYISPTIDSIVRTTGGVYIDVNKQIESLPATTEFYVDYCHLTPTGNEYVAGLMFEQAKKFIEKKILNNIKTHPQ